MKRKITHLFSEMSLKQCKVSYPRMLMPGLTLLLFLISLSSWAQVPIVYYDFEDNSNRSSLQTNVEATTNSASNITRDNSVSITGVSGAGAALHSGSAGTAIESSFSNSLISDPQTGATEYFEFSFTKTGFQNLTLKLDIASSTSGPANFGILYKLDSGPIMHLETRSATTSWVNQSFTLPADFNSAGSVVFYIYGYNGTSGGTLMIDNIMVSADRISSGSATLINEADVYAGFTSGGTGSYPRTNLSIDGTADITLNYPLAVNGAVSVGAGAKLKFGTANARLEGTGSFALNNGASIEIASPNGITSSANSGNVRVTGTRTFDSGANYRYIQDDGSASATGDGLPAIISGSLTIDLLDNAFVSVSNPISLSNPSTKITGALNLTSGKLITTASNVLLVDAAGTVTGGSTSSFIDGPLAYEVTGTGTTHNLDFEIGSGANYRKVTLAVTHDDGDAVTYTVNQVESAAPGTSFATGGDELDRVSKVRYFTLDLVKTGSTTASGTISLSYGSDDGVNQESHLRIASLDGSTWSSIGGTANAGTISSSNIASLPVSGTFALGNAKGGTNPLPVELARFTATKKTTDVVLDWTTASEKDNKGFEVQVAPEKGEFRTLGFVASRNSNSTAMLNYTFTDTETGKNGTRYYRLKQIDFNGTVSYSALRAVSFGKAILQVSVYPNPVGQQLLIQVAAGSNNQTGTVEITDALGRMVLVQQLTLQEGGNQAAINLPASVTKGIYTVALKTSEGVVYNKIVKE